MKQVFKGLKALDGQRLNLNYIDFKDVGLEDNDDGADVKYDMQGEVFYSDQITDDDVVNQIRSNSKMAPEVKKEITDFDKLIADCQAVLNRKTDIILLWNLSNMITLWLELLILNLVINFENNIYR